MRRLICRSRSEPDFAWTNANICHSVFSVRFGGGMKLKSDTSSLPVLGIATAMLMAVTGVFWSSLTPSPDRGVHVTGTVIRSEPAVVRAKPTHVRIIRYEYEGQTYEVEGPIPNRFGYRTGKELRVTLSPDAPSKGVLSSTASFYVFRILTGVLAALSLISAALLARTLFVSQRSENRKGRR